MIHGYAAKQQAFYYGVWMSSVRSLIIRILSRAGLLRIIRMIFPGISVSYRPGSWDGPADPTLHFYCQSGSCKRAKSVLERLKLRHNSVSSSLKEAALAEVYFDWDADLTTPKKRPRIFCILDCGSGRLTGEKLHQLRQVGTKILYFKLSMNAESAEPLAPNIQVFDLRKGFTPEQQDVHVASRIEEAAEQLIQRHDSALDALKGYSEGTAVVQLTLLDIEFLPPASEVAFVIPTLNGGPEFERTLRSIREQRIYSDSAVLIVDSGSTDCTLELAQRYEATVFSIDRSQFNHGTTRDLIISKTIAKFVVLLVQDAALMDSETIPNMLRHLAAPSVAGVYTSPLPVAGHDEYATREVLAYRTYLGPMAKAFSLRADAYEQLDFWQRLQALRFDNVCSVVRRSVWEKIKFGQTDFGEDISWCKRAQLSGHSIVYDPFARVFHSHMRSPEYTRKRCTSELYHVSSMLDSCPVDYGSVDISEIEWVTASISTDVEGLLERVREVNAKGALTVSCLQTLLACAHLEIQCLSSQVKRDWRAERFYFLELIGAMYFDKDAEIYLQIDRLESLLEKAKAAAIGGLWGKYLGSYLQNHKTLTPALSERLRLASQGV